MRIELRCNVRIESNRKVPQTNRLSLGVLDMDVIVTWKLVDPRKNYTLYHYI